MTYPFPVNYQPAYQYPQYQQNYTQQSYTQPMQNPTTSTNGMIFVNNQKEAEDWLIQRGETVILWDKNRPVFYIKSADNRGMPLPIEIKEYKDSVVEEPKIQETEGKFVTTDEFEKRIGELNKQIFDLMNEVSNKKGDKDGKQLIV